MGRKCVCQICKKKGNTDEFYKLSKNGKNKYYCSKEEYDQYQLNITKRYELLKFIAEDILEYENGQIVPPIMVKKIDNLSKFYDFEVIHKCFELKQNDIKYWIKTKEFDNEYGMSSYVMRIVENNINDVYEEWKRKKQTIEKEKTELDVEIINEVMETKTTVKKANNGILDFLDEEDI